MYRERGHVLLSGEKGELGRVQQGETGKIGLSCKRPYKILVGSSCRNWHWGAIADI